MNPSALSLDHEAGRAVTISAGGAVLFRYVYAPGTQPGESPRPYAHPVNSLAGDRLSGFRPNDHPWHQGLSLTVTNLSGVNFWGGPTYRREDSYRWRNDHGEQRHREWLELSPARLRHTLAWHATATGEVMLDETRELLVSAAAGSWSLEWASRLVNVTGRTLEFGDPDTAGLPGSHYTGLQFRGARALLDDHGDAAIRLCSEGANEGEKAVHGAPGRWMEWHVQSDETLRRTLIRFENPSAPIRWFVRRAYPLATFSLNREPGLTLPAGGAIDLRHRLTFADVP